jgi:predicted ATP-dependent endonuclease of OLD family
LVLSMMNASALKAIVIRASEKYEGILIRSNTAHDMLQETRGHVLKAIESLDKVIRVDGIMLRDTEELVVTLQTFFYPAPLEIDVSKQNLQHRHEDLQELLSSLAKVRQSLEDKANVLNTVSINHQLSSRHDNTAQLLNDYKDRL